MQQGCTFISQKKQRYPNADWWLHDQILIWSWFSCSRHLLSFCWNQDLPLVYRPGIRLILNSVQELFCEKTHCFYLDMLDVELCSTILFSSNKLYPSPSINYTGQSSSLTVLTKNGWVIVSTWFLLLCKEDGCVSYLSFGKTGLSSRYVSCFSRTVSVFL